MHYDFKTLLDGVCFVLFLFGAVSWLAFGIIAVLALTDVQIPDGHTWVDFIRGSIPHDDFSYAEDAAIQTALVIALRAAIILTILFVLIRPIKI